MMLELLSVDSVVLASGLLHLAKEHMRVEFDRDDAYIEMCVARAIAEVEGATNLSINPAQYRWRPSLREYQTCCYNLRVPVQPVREITEDVDGVLTPVAFDRDGFYAYSECGQQYDREYLVDVGYLAADDLPPSVISPVLMIAASLYEQRESLQSGTIHELPDHTRRLVTGLWRPSV